MTPRLLIQQPPVAHTHQNVSFRQLHPNKSFKFSNYCTCSLAPALIPIKWMAGWVRMRTLLNNSPHCWFDGLDTLQMMRARQHNLPRLSWSVLIRYCGLLVIHHSSVSPAQPTKTLLVGVNLVLRVTCYTSLITYNVRMAHCKISIRLTGQFSRTKSSYSPVSLCSRWKYYASYVAFELN